MQMQYLGCSCLKLSGQQTEANIVIDPFGAEVGWKMSRQSADIVLVTTKHQAFEATDLVKGSEDGEPFMITTAGEYEVKKAFVYGVEANRKDPAAKEPTKTIMYSINLDEVIVGHLGSINRPLTEAELDQLGRIDILCLPVGSYLGLTSGQAMDVIAQIEPRIVIPIAYQLPKLDLPYEPLDKFLKAFGGTGVEYMDKLKINKKDLPSEDTKIIVLNAA